MNVYILSIELPGGIATVALGAYSTFADMQSAAEVHMKTVVKSHTPVYFYEVKGMGDPAEWTNQQMGVTLQTQQQQYAHWIMQLMDGDTHHINNMLTQMREDGMIDENHEEIYGKQDE
jgi:hypothetical protein